MENQLLLYPDVQYRGGTYPMERTDDGIDALLADTSAAAPCLAGLQVFVLGTDNFEIAAAAGASPLTNAPAGLSAQELADICEANQPDCLTWNEPPSAPAGVSTDAIIPVIPPPSSGDRAVFMADLDSATGASGQHHLCHRRHSLCSLRAVPRSAAQPGSKPAHRPAV